MSNDIINQEVPKHFFLTIMVCLAKLLTHAFMRKIEALRVSIVLHWFGAAPAVQNVAIDVVEGEA